MRHRLLLIGLIFASQIHAQIPGPSSKDSLAMLTKISELKAERKQIQSQSIQLGEELYHSDNQLKQIQARLNTTDSNLLFLRKQITDLENLDSKSADTRRMIRTGKEMIKEHERMLASIKKELTEADRRKSDAERLLQKAKEMLDQLAGRIERMEYLLQQ